ncbi:MAG: protein NO VEIN domain-containing protein [Flavobacterium sp.]|uniref:protein NO VEIN domain-containing protein n=1 Tax=Flavobacterium sp. TaxID=239 RepID=UPI003D0C97F5
MNIHFDILIDSSGSMGIVKDKTENNDINFLLKDGLTTRTELVKKILIKSIIPKLSFANTLSFKTFCSKVILNEFGNPKLKAGNKQYSPLLDDIYTGEFNLPNINLSINNIQIPFDAGTPLCWATSVAINNSNSHELNIIIFSDGTDSDIKNYDEIILDTITKKNKQCKIYFIGIGQDNEAQVKSKNLADKTGGFYINLNDINYDEKLFDNILFEWTTTITSNVLKSNLKIDGVSEEKIVETQLNKNIVKKEISDLETQVVENTESLKLIALQLDSIVKEISFIRNEKLDATGDFFDDQNEDFNRVIGYKCEEFLYNKHLKVHWENISWLNQFDEQSKPYDFEIIVKEKKFFIECKGSVNDSKEFYLTKKEWEFYLSNRDNYRLYFVSEFNSENPEIIKISDIIKSMEKGELIPCSKFNRKVKRDRIIFQIIS